MLPKLWLIIHFQLVQFLHVCSIFVVLIGCVRPPCIRGVAVFYHIGPYSFPCFQEGHIPLLLHLEYFLLFSCKHRKILRKPDDLIGSLHIEFASSNLPSNGPGPFHRIWHMSVVLSRLPCSVHISGIWSTSGALGRTAQLSQDNIRSSPPWEYGANLMSGCKCWSEFLMEILLIFVALYFPRADAISSSVANVNSLLLITPLEVFLMNLRKSAASFSKSDSYRFHLFFFIWRHQRCGIFFAGPSTESNLCWECIKGETHLPWLRRGYTTSMLDLRVGFRAVANFRFAALVKFLFSQRNWLSATGF